MAYFPCPSPSHAASYAWLKDYRARFYSPRLGRFTQPDSKVASIAVPKSLNRFSYVYNNPMNFVDPTGHIACEDLKTEACDEKGEYTNEDATGITNTKGFVTWALGTLDPNLSDKEKVIEVAKMVAEGLAFVDDLEAMAQIVDAAVMVYGEYSREMFSVLSEIFIGVPLNGPGAVTGTFVLQDLLRIPPGENYIPFGDTGFDPSYQDGSNQVFHFWANFVSVASGNFYTSMFSGPEVIIGNFVHEPIQGALSNKFGWNRPGSWKDFLLTNQAYGLGTSVAFGNIRPGELGNELRDQLGFNGGSNGLNNLNTWFGPLDVDVDK